MTDAVPWLVELATSVRTLAARVSLPVGVRLNVSSTAVPPSNKTRRAARR